MKKIVSLIIALFLLAILAPTVEAASLQLPMKQGSKDSNVIKIQKVLKAHNYPVKPDGIYGATTIYYVKKYQQAHGLYPDGKVGVYTWQSMMASEQDKLNIQLLAKIIMREAGGSSDREQIAIGNVVVGYAAKEKRTIEAEIKSGRYSPALNWISFLKTKPSAKCTTNALKVYYAGEKAFDGKQPYFFHAASYKPPANSWWTKLPRLGKVDKTVFYSSN